MLPISSALYSCSECSFFLHKWCAELPEELQHPCHPEHPRVLSQKPMEVLVDSGVKAAPIFVEDSPSVVPNVNFTLMSARFGSLPDSIRHEAHKHLLIRSGKLVGRCSACDRYLSGLSFTCDTCNFKLHAQCALLPRKIRHR